MRVRKEQKRVVVGAHPITQVPHTLFLMGETNFHRFEVLSCNRKHLGLCCDAVLQDGDGSFALMCLFKLAHSTASRRLSIRLAPAIKQSFHHIVLSSRRQENEAPNNQLYNSVIHPQIHAIVTTSYTQNPGWPLFGGLANSATVRS
jgi:hypothetical protein